MAGEGRSWSTEDVYAILNMDGTETDLDLGARLGRTVKSIRCKRDKIRNGKRRWVGKFDLVDTNEL